MRYFIYSIIILIGGGVIITFYDNITGLDMDRKHLAYIGHQVLTMAIGAIIFFTMIKPLLGNIRKKEV